MPPAQAPVLAGRYNVPAGLERHPLNVLWWTFVALPFYMAAVGLLLSQLAPGTYQDLVGDTGDPNQDAALWVAVVLVELMVFWRMTRWSIRNGLGSAVGSLALPANWVLLAIFLSLAELWFVPTILESVFQPIETYWGWRDPEEARAFAETALTGAALASLIIMSPVLEEITFRGMAMGWMLARGIPPIMTVVVTSAAFAMLHTQYTPLGMIPIFTAGLLYGWLRLASGSVAIPIIAHMTANAAVIWIQSSGG